MVASVVAAAFLLASGGAVWSFLRFTKSFGDFTESQREFTKAILEVNQNYLLMHQSHVELLERLKAQQDHIRKEVAA